MRDLITSAVPWAWWTLALGAVLIVIGLAGRMYHAWRNNTGGCRHRPEYLRMVRTLRRTRGGTLPERLADSETGQYHTVPQDGA